MTIANIIFSLFLITFSTFLVLMTLKLIKNKKIKKIINITIYIIYIIMVITSIQKIVYKDNRIFNYYIYKISSGSMENTLHVNDYIIVKKLNNYKKGDIITFKNNKNKIITHRIVNINNNEITTRGDANFNVDKTINKNQIIGKVIIHGFILNLYMNYISYIIIIYSTIYIIIDIFKPKKE